MSFSYLTKKQECDVLKAQLDNEMSSFTSHWRDLSDYVLPRRAKFSITDTNKGDKRNKNIIDSTATMAARTLRSGLMAGVTSPARPWFRLGFSDRKVSEAPNVKAWTTEVEEEMRQVFARSNLYKALPIVYGDMGVFATGCLFVEEDFETVMRFTVFPIGSYGIACDEKGRVRVFSREFQMTVRQIVEKFGKIDGSNEIDWTNISESVKSLYDQKNMETWINIVHMIKPNPDFNPKRINSKYKKFMSVYYESGTQASGQQDSSRLDKFLSEKGYDYFPVLVPRWETTGEDVYGTNCPGMASLGDNKQLQLGEKRAAELLEKIVRPPMVGPTSLKNAKASILPGDITYVADADLGKSAFRPAYQVDGSALPHLENKQAQIRQRISRAFYEDLFLMLAQAEDTRKTATEIVERKEEKLLALGPVLEQLNQDLLDPLIDIAFYLMNKQGFIPEPPQEIQGQEIKVDYISIMAQAQKLAGIGNIERYIGFVGQLAGIKPAALDNLDEDYACEIYADLVGAPLKINRGKDVVAQIREDRAAVAQQEQQAAVAMASVDAAKNLSETSMDGNSALKQLVG